jgi:hypothetical protein
VNPLDASPVVLVAGVRVLLVALIEKAFLLVFPALRGPMTHVSRLVRLSGQSLSAVLANVLHERREPLAEGTGARSPRLWQQRVLHARRQAAPGLCDGGHMLRDGEFPLRTDRRAVRRASAFRMLATCGGVAGPLLFTAAWVVSLLRQPGHPAARMQLSGLAAEDARDPQIMMAAFVVLGACLIGFGAALRRMAARSAGPWLVMAAGVAAVAAGVFRRDHLLLTGPGFAGESWHNQIHDVASGIAYVTMLTAPWALARRFRTDPDWAVITRPVQGLALASAVTMAIFASRALEPSNGVVQRTAVTLALTAQMLVAVRMLTLPPGPVTRRRASTFPTAQTGGTRSRPCR